jgi:hypothetical protein
MVNIRNLLAPATIALAHACAVAVAQSPLPTYQANPEIY